MHLTVAWGGFTCLLGPSGCGKSTLLNVLAGLEAPDEGEVRVAGLAPHLRSHSTPVIAYMQQKDLLLPWRSVWDNVLLGPELVGGKAGRAAQAARARAMLREFGLEDFASAWPAQLSGGMRQRAALLRTLLCGGRILLLDEPFGALDAITRRRLQSLLLRVWRQHDLTVLLVTHDVDEALRLGQEVLLMGGAPGAVRKRYAIDLPHAARERAPQLLDLKAEILDTLETESGPPGEAA